MSVVLPASGWLMIANVRRRAASVITCWDMACQPTDMATDAMARNDRPWPTPAAARRRGATFRRPPSTVEADGRRGPAHLVAGVPMPWMTRWPGGFPIHVAEAAGARFVDVDGIEYVDFCLGDTGAMSGHGGVALADAIAAQLSNGLTTMLPTGDAAWVGAELARRFRAAEVADGDDGDRREPLRAAVRPASHAAAEDRGDGLVLPRHGRRDARDPRRRWSASVEPTRERSARRSIRRSPPESCRSTTSDALERALGARRRRRAADGAGAHEHRHRAARRRLPRRRPRTHPPSRDAARHRRDAHDLRRARRMHRGVGSRPGLRR